MKKRKSKKRLRLSFPHKRDGIDGLYRIELTDSVEFSPGDFLHRAEVRLLSDTRPDVKIVMVPLPPAPRRARRPPPRRDGRALTVRDWITHQESEQKQE